MRTRWIVISIHCLVLYLSQFSSVCACDAYPLDTGLSWTYRYANGGTFTRTVEGPSTINGQEVVSVRTDFDYDPGGTARWYYSVSATGEVLAHGSENDQYEHTEVLYLPPYVCGTCQHWVGQTWHVSTNAYDNLDGNGTGTPTDYTFYVESYEQIDTPAGPFLAYQIRQTSDSWGYEQRYWRAPGIGLVRFALVVNGSEWISYGLLEHDVVSVQSLSWSEIKALYR